MLLQTKKKCRNGGRKDFVFLQTALVFCVDVSVYFCVYFCLFHLSMDRLEECTLSIREKEFIHSSLSFFCFFCVIKSYKCSNKVSLSLYLTHYEHERRTLPTSDDVKEQKGKGIENKKNKKADTIHSYVCLVNERHLSSNFLSLIRRKNNR